MALTTVIWLFWLALGVLVYTWIGYPVCLYVLERLLYRPVRKADAQPEVTILICAHNEEDRIAAKIENLLALDYPQHKLHIVIATDGSHDRTADIVRRYERESETTPDGVPVRLVEFATRRGKPSVLNDVVPTVPSEIVVLCDTRQRLEAATLNKLVGNFADPEIGGVSGELVFETPERVGIATGTDTYWTYEKWIRLRESGVHSTVGGTGALFALRRSAWREIPPETILDDVVIPFRIVSQGYRVVLEMGARAWDYAEVFWQREFERKTRTLSGNFQILFSLAKLGPGLRLLGMHGFQYVSHKVTRLLGPLCLVVMFVANWQLLLHLPTTEGAYRIYKICMAGQVFFYLLAFAGGMLQHRARALPGLMLPYSFMVMQLAVVVGFLRFASGRDDVLWEKAHLIEPGAGRERVWRLFIDSTLFVMSFLVAFYILYWGAPPPAALSSYMALFPYVEFPLVNDSVLRLAFPWMMVIPMTVFYFFRVNEPETDEITPEYFLTLIKGVFTATGLLLMTMYVMRASLLQVQENLATPKVVSFPLSVFLIGFILNCLVIGGWRLVLLHWGGSAAGQERRVVEYLLTGDLAGAERGTGDFTMRFSAPTRVRSIQDVLTNAVGGDATLRDSHDRLRQCLRLNQHKADGLLVAPTALSRQAVLDAVTVAEEYQLPVHLLPGPLELLLGRSPPRLTSYIPVVDIDRRGVGRLTRFCKRGVDIGVGGLWLLLGTPAMLAVKFGEAGRLSWLPVERCGAYGNSYTLRRIRFAGTASTGRSRGLRRFINGWQLFRGTLTLVGVRSLTPRQFAKLDAVARRFYRGTPGLFFLRRLAVSQKGELRGGSAALIYYARHASLALDLRILLDAWQQR